ncbi:MAG: cysteine desulfurase [Maricaulaceae bacterium]|nr:cysteine desulfurase [Maricaulaceae bacterium]
MSVYLDHNATTPLRPEAGAAMLRALERAGNPSSVHASGRAARALVEQARATLARLVCARAEDVIFTGGGTEANNLAIEGAVATGQIKRIIVSAMEHDAVSRCAAATNLPVEFLPPRKDGTADLDWLAQRLARWSAEADGTPFVCLQAANNETGVIQPYAEAGRMLGEAGGLLHIDAVQALGKFEFDFAASGAAYAALSAHKAGGPQGVGALVLSCDAPFSRPRKGGGQEKGRRDGTENVAGIAGFAAAAEAAVRDLELFEGLAALRDRAADGVRKHCPDAHVIGEGAARLANTLCVAAPGWPGEMQVIALDLEGVEVSAGSACSSGKTTAGRALTAIAGEALARCAIRVSLGWTTTETDIERFIAAWGRAYARIKAQQPVQELA